MASVLTVIGMLRITALSAMANQDEKRLAGIKEGKPIPLQIFRM